MLNVCDNNYSVTSKCLANPFKSVFKNSETVLHLDQKGNLNQYVKAYFRFT